MKDRSDDPSGYISVRHSYKIKAPRNSYRNEEGKQVGSVLFNDTLNTLFIYGCMVLDIWLRTQRYSF